jgi:hypothetical protein
MPDEFRFDDGIVDDEQEEDEWDEENNELLYLKHMFEGCGTLAELSLRLRGLADELDRMSTDGWRLVQPVDTGYAHLVREGE